MRLWWSEA
ncbi:rhs element Vgr family protein, partial [Vibrio paracholerae HE-16]